MRILTTVLSLFAGLFVATAASADDWILYKAPDRAYSLRFPAPPLSENNGKTIYSTSQKHVVYELQIADIDGLTELKSAKAFAAADQYATSGGGSILSLKNFNFHGHPAQDLKFSARGKIYWNRVIIVDHRLYQLIVGTDLKRAPRPDQFWKSFSLKP